MGTSTVVRYSSSLDAVHEIKFDSAENSSQPVAASSAGRHGCMMVMIGFGL